MKRILVTVAALFVLLLVLACVWFWRSLGKPLYQPGMVRSGLNLRAHFELPPQGNDAAFWNVEKDSLGKRHDYRRALRLANAPALVLHGQDDILPDQASRSYVEALPNARLYVFKSGKTSGLGGAVHAVFTDQPEAFAKVVGEFLEVSKRTGG